jgi:type II restriction enzyme
MGNIYITDEEGRESFRKKSESLKRLINETIFIIESFGTPLNGLTPRRMERMALCFLALADVKSPADWKKIKSIEDKVSMRSRDIIKYINRNLQDKISLGSYDDIRRRDLKLLILSGIVIRTRPSADINDSTRGYAISPEHAKLIRHLREKNWSGLVVKFLKSGTTLAEKLTEERAMEQIPIKVSPGKTLLFSLGKHNILQKAVIEEFLPRFGYGAEVLYIGDAAKKQLYKNEKKLKELKFFELSRNDLPDVLAYSSKKNWLFLIEAVYTSGPVSKTRKIELEELTKNCKAKIIYITAFLDKETFRKFIVDIAWETEVWIAESPDHLVHFNGDKFLGPYVKR